MLANVTLGLIANAIGLIVAAAVLDEMTLDAGGFVIAVAIFTGVLVLSQPLMVKMSLKYASALSGSSALLAVLVSLLVTDLVSDGLEIAGVGTWLFAAVIVWAASLVGALLLPLVLFKNVLREGGTGRPDGPKERVFGA